MHRIRNSGLEDAGVPPFPKPTKVAHKETVEEYDDDFDVNCDLACMKVRPIPYSLNVQL
jgi:hypothetical protein